MLTVKADHREQWGGSVDITWRHWIKEGAVHWMHRVGKGFSVGSGAWHQVRRTSEFGEGS